MGISALGGEEKPLVLMLQIFTMPKAYYTAPLVRGRSVAAACPFRHGSALDTHNVGRAQLSSSMIRLFLVIDQSLTCFLCAVHLAMGGPLLLLRWRRSDCRASLVRNGVRWRDYTGK